MLGEIGAEVERIEDLEVASGAAEEVRTGRIGESVAVGLVRAGEHRAVLRDADRTCETERTADEVPGEAFEAGGVSGRQTDAPIDGPTRIECPIP